MHFSKTISIFILATILAIAVQASPVVSTNALEERDLICSLGEIACKINCISSGTMNGHCEEGECVCSEDDSA
ncbi:hypothetical protein MVEG_10561 [Podila verticillata NRRL 6337]|nr:hypothetical protein MVEG_10561 [Podila verticillata NRRL 6337]